MDHQKKLRSRRIERWRSIFFLIGLVLSLSAVMALFQLRTPVVTASAEPTGEPISLFPDPDEVIHTITPEPDPRPKNEKSKPNPETFTTDPKPVVNYTPPDLDPGGDDIDSVIEVLPEPDTIPVSVHALDRLPIYAGCENERNEKTRRACLMESLTRQIVDGLSFTRDDMMWASGKRMFAEIVINNEGSVTEVTILRAPTARIELQTIDILKNLPKFTPGLKDGRVRATRLSIPIVIQSN